MKKNKKKIAATLVSLLLAMSMMSMTVFAGPDGTPPGDPPGDAPGGGQGGPGGGGTSALVSYTGASAITNSQTLSVNA